MSNAILDRLARQAAEWRTAARELGIAAEQARPHVDEAADNLVTAHATVRDLEEQMAALQARLSQARQTHQAAKTKHGQAVGLVRQCEAAAGQAADIADHLDRLAAQHRDGQEPPPPGEALAAAGLPGSPEAVRDAADRAAGEDPMPFNVREAEPDTVAAITSGTPVAGELVATSGPTITGPIDPAVTLPDTGLAPAPLPPAEPSDQPRHAKPKKNIEWSGAFKAITGRIGEQGGVA